MVSPVLGINHVQRELAGVDFTTTGDKWVLTPARPINIIRWGIVADALIDVGAGMVVALDFRPTAGSDSGRVNGATSSGRDTAGGTLSTGTTDVAAGSGSYRDLVPVAASGLSATGTGEYGGFQVDPGEQAVFEVTDAADTAGSSGVLFVEYVTMPAGQGSRWTAKMTKKTS